MAVVLPTPGRPVIATRPLIGISTDSILTTMVDKTTWLDVIEAELARHPRMDEQDLQKLVYQSVFGGDHLLEDPERFAAGLRAEWAKRPADDGRPALQSM